MCVFSAGCSPTVPEPELYRSIQAVLPREVDKQQGLDSFNKGTTSCESEARKLHLSFLKSTLTHSQSSY